MKNRTRNFRNFTFIAITLLSFATLAQAQNTDYQKHWTTVGSACTVDEADTAKVEFNKSTVQMKGSGIIVAQSIASFAAQRTAEAQATAASVIVQLPTDSAVVRYNVTAVDGLFMGAPYGTGDSYGMTVRYWASGTSARVTVRLVEVDIYTGVEVERMKLDSASFASSTNYQTQGIGVNRPNWKFDFTQKAYYLEATLTRSAIVAGGAAGISAIKLNSTYRIT